MKNRTTVLLVEDSPGDIRLTQEAFREAEATTDLHVVSDGPDAIAFLRGEGKHAGAAQPDLILLDLNLPKMGGFEVLSQIKRDPDLMAIPTIILTTSQAGTDVLASYQLQANCYLRKPAEWEEFERLMRTTLDFWLRKTRLPTRQQEQGASNASNHQRIAQGLGTALPNKLVSTGERDSR